MLPLRTVTATRYVTPLREGGSLPGVVEGDDDGTYVVKLHGAGQGPKALVAELLAGEIGRALGLAVPEIVLVELDPRLGRSEPDDEVRALLKASAGLNLGMDFLPGALAFDPLAAPPDLDEALASAIVWFDAFVVNVDRTPRNTNLLVWHRRLWLIDHGAALYVSHGWTSPRDHSRSGFAAIRQHVLLERAARLDEADARLRDRLSPSLLAEIVDAIPDAWLPPEPRFPDAAAHRAAYLEYLVDRLGSRAFVEEALRARALHV